jgi:two-component system OmpR family response regulator
MIIILDDEPYFVESFSDTLKLEGYEVEIATNEEEFFYKLEKYHPDAVVIDIMLQSGFE